MPNILLSQAPMCQRHSGRHCWMAPRAITLGRHLVYLPTGRRDGCALGRGSPVYSLPVSPPSSHPCTLPAMLLTFLGGQHGQPWSSILNSEIIPTLSLYQPHSQLLHLPQTTSVTLPQPPLPSHALNMVGVTATLLSKNSAAPSISVPHQTPQLAALAPDI